MRGEPRLTRTPWDIGAVRRRGHRWGPPVYAGSRRGPEFIVLIRERPTGRLVSACRPYQRPERWRPFRPVFAWCDGVCSLLGRLCPIGIPRPTSDAGFPRGVCGWRCHTGEARRWGRRRCDGVCGGCRGVWCGGGCGWLFTWGSCSVRLLVAVGGVFRVGVPLAWVVVGRVGLGGLGLVAAGWCSCSAGRVDGVVARWPRVRGRGLLEGCRMGFSVVVGGWGARGGASGVAGSLLGRGVDGVAPMPAGGLVGRGRGGGERSGLLLPRACREAGV